MKRISGNSALQKPPIMVIESFGFASVLPASKVKKKMSEKKTQEKSDKRKKENIFSPSQEWKNIHTYGSSAYTGPSTLKHTARCSSKKSVWLSRSRHRCSTRYRQTDQLSAALDTPSASNKADQKTSRDSGQSSLSIKSMLLFLFVICLGLTSMSK